MVSVSDITKLLDMLPLWKQLKTLPDRIDQLEKRLASLEKQPVAEFEQCPSCKQKTFVLIESKPDAVFGAVGGNRNIFRCSSCGFEKSTLDK